jgi:ligand-binding sensor domain-containing protein
LFGPEKLHGWIYSVLDCCEPGTLIGTNRRGVRQLGKTGEWLRLDDDTFDALSITSLLRLDGVTYAAADFGLFYSVDGQNWQRPNGLPSAVTDLVVDPGNPDRWLAGTPVGVYRSPDRGQTWEVISPPWPIWDMSFGPGGRLFLARTNGMAWTDTPGSPDVPWQTADGLEQVLFFSVNPHPTDANTVWAGTWGNNIAASSDGGLNIEPIHHGLETLSVLDLIWHTTPGQITAGTINGIYRTDDGGQSWFRLPGPLTHQTVYSLLQSDDGAIWAGVTNGLWISRDYGVTWRQTKGLPPVTVLRLGKIPSLSSQETGDTRLWAGTEEAGLWLSQDGGASWEFGGLGGHNVYALLPDASDETRWVAATNKGIFGASSERTIK